MDFNFFLPTQLVFGAGKLTQIADYVSGQNVMIICDPVIKNLGILDKVNGLLENRNVIAFSDVEAEPGIEVVDKAAGVAAKNDIHVIIGLGGGSSLDTAKAVAVIMTNGGSLSDYVKDAKKIEKKRLPLVLIPTTAGTGSECTAVGIFSDHRNNKKFPFFSQELRPDTAIIDPELTYTAPPQVTAATGIDAFTHAIESYWNITDSPVTDMVAIRACDLVLKNLFACYENPHDAEARANMSLASMMGGFTFGQTKTTAIHSMSFPLADLYKINHGTACAMTLVPITQFIYPAVREKMDKLIGYCGYHTFDDFINVIRTLLKKMNFPESLTDIGAKVEDLEYIVDVTMSFQMTELMPRKITRVELFDLLKKILTK